MTGRGFHVTPCEILNLGPGATGDDAGRARNKLAAVMHPDRAGPGAQAIMQLLNHAAEAVAGGQGQVPYVFGGDTADTRNRDRERQEQSGTSGAAEAPGTPGTPGAPGTPGTARNARNARNSGNARNARNSGNVEKRQERPDPAGAGQEGTGRTRGNETCRCGRKKKPEYDTCFGCSPVELCPVCGVQYYNAQRFRSCWTCSMG